LNVNHAQVYGPPVPEWAQYETQFLVNVSAGVGGSRHSSRPSYVYNSQAPSDAPKPQQGKTLYYTTFSFTGRVTVFITDLTQTIVPSSCKVLPSSLNIKCTHPDPAYPYTVALTLESNTETKNHISVEFGLPSGFSTTKQLMIFGEPLEEDVPEATNHTTAEGTVVKYYPPGLYDLGANQLNVFDGTMVYIAGGAYLFGGFTTPPGTNKVL
jgi:hypothetical protein